MYFNTLDKVDPADKSSFVRKHNIAKNHTGNYLYSSTPGHEPSFDDRSEQCQTNLNSEK